MSKFDRDLKTGDIITAYEAGYHVVVKVEQRFDTPSYRNSNIGTYYPDERYSQDRKPGQEVPSIIHYKRVVTEAGKKVNSKRVLSCDASYCQKVTHERIERQAAEELIAFYDKYKNIRSLLEPKVYQ